MRQRRIKNRFMMQIDEISGAMQNQALYPPFQADPIPDEMIEKILECCRWAMSGGNGQPWEFIVVKDKVIKKKIAKLVEERDKAIWPIEKTRIPEVRHPAFREGADGVPLKHLPRHRSLL